MRAPGTVFTFFVYLQQCRTKSKLADTAIHDALVLLLISHILVPLPLLRLLGRMTFPHTPCAHCARAKRNWHGLRRQRRLRTYDDDDRKYKNWTQWWLSFEANAVDDDDVRRAPLIKVKNVKILESFWVVWCATKRVEVQCISCTGLYCVHNALHVPKEEEARA